MWRPVMAAFRASARPSPSPAVAAPAPIGTPPPLDATMVASCTALHRQRGPSAATARLPARAPASRIAHVGHRRRHLLGRLRHPPPSGPPQARRCIGRLGTSAVVTRPHAWAPTPHVVCDGLRLHHRAEYPPRGQSDWPSARPRPAPSTPRSRPDQSPACASAGSREDRPSMSAYPPIEQLAASASTLQAAAPPPRGSPGGYLDLHAAATSPLRALASLHVVHPAAPRPYPRLPDTRVAAASPLQAVTPRHAIHAASPRSSPPSPPTRAAAASPLRAIAPWHAVHSAVPARRLLRGMRRASLLGAGTSPSALLPAD